MRKNMANVNNSLASSQEKQSETLVVDGSNVCYWYGQVYKTQDSNDNKLSIRPLLVVLSEIKEHGDDFICIFDASICNSLRKFGNIKDANFIEYLLNNYRFNFHRVPTGFPADEVILNNANKQNRRIISVDNYSQYSDKYEWLIKERPTRLIKGSFLYDGTLTLHNLSYGDMKVNDVPTRELIDRLEKCLSKQTSLQPQQSNNTKSDIKENTIKHISESEKPDKNVEAQIQSNELLTNVETKKKKPEKKLKIVKNGRKAVVAKCNVKPKVKPNKKKPKKVLAKKQPYIIRKRGNLREKIPLKNA